MQKITSKNTSQNQVAGFYKKALKSGIINNESIIFDYGCGKYFNNVVDFATENDFAVFGYDVYNMSKNHNIRTMQRLRFCNMITCNNVLNVLDNESIIDVISDLSNLSTVMSGLPVYITIYEGNRTGKGRITKPDCYQRNEKTSLYIEQLEMFFRSVAIKNNIIKCK